MPETHRTAAIGTLPIEQTNDMTATSGPSSALSGTCNKGEAPFRNSAAQTPPVQRPKVRRRSETRRPGPSTASTSPSQILGDDDMGARVFQLLPDGLAGEYHGFMLVPAAGFGMM